MILGINVGEDEDTIFQFTVNYPVEFPLLMVQDSKITDRWPLRCLPTTFVVIPRAQSWEPISSSALFERRAVRVQCGRCRRPIEAATWQYPRRAPPRATGRFNIASLGSILPTWQASITITRFPASTSASHSCSCSSPSFLPLASV